MTRETPRILTFCWHEGYLWLLAKTGYLFDVAEPDRGRGMTRRWNHSARPLPVTMSLVEEQDALAALHAGAYDLVLLHNESDLALVARAEVPKVALFHNRLSTLLALGGGTVSRERYLSDCAPLFGKADRLVFTSEAKRDDWGFREGVVIPHAVILDEAHPYQGDERVILRVGARLWQRDLMMGAALQEELVAGFPHRLIGDNPDLAGADPAKNYDTLLLAYARSRLYLSTLRHPYEDFYNLALLEAMAAGTPVVAAAHPDTFITHGVDGYVSEDSDELRSQIKNLLDDPAHARVIGARGRETAARLFPLEKFVTSWRQLFESLR